MKALRSARMIYNGIDSNRKQIDITNGDIRIRSMTEEDFPLMLKWLTDVKVLEFYGGRDTHYLREIVSFARVHEDRFVQMVMDTDMKQRNKDLAKKKKLFADAEKRIVELDNIIKRLYEDNITDKLTDERFLKLSLDYENEQRDLNGQVVLLREEIEAAESKSADVSRFLSIVKQYTEIPELTPFILHEFVEKIVIHNATDPHSKTNRRQEVDIYYKGIGILEMSKVFDDRQK